VFDFGGSARAPVVYVLACARVRVVFDCVCDGAGMDLGGVCKGMGVCVCVCAVTTCLSVCSTEAEAALCVSAVCMSVLALCLALRLRGANREESVCAMTSVNERERLGFGRVMGEFRFFVCVLSLILCLFVCWYI